MSPELLIYISAGQDGMTAANATGQPV